MHRGASEMFKHLILCTVLVLLLAIGVGCDLNEVGNDAHLLVRGNVNPYVPADDKRCLDTFTMLDKTGFEASAIFTAKAGIIETNIDECLEWIITGPLEDK
jgi:hypothetical protein